jgi:hypothetical protein
VAGKVLDAVTGRPVSGAVVSDGKKAVALTDRQGEFELRPLDGAAVDLIVQHPSYAIFAQAAVPLGRRVEIKVQPSSIEAEPVEIVETREEDLRPLLRAQAPFRFPLEFEYRHRGHELKGLYRVCVGRNGRISLVAALDPVADGDEYVQEGIAKGWEYRSLPRPACFFWRVTLRFSGGTPVRVPTPQDQFPARGPFPQPK